MVSVWSLSAKLAYDNLPLVHVGVVSDAGGQRFTAGTQADLDVATSLPELNAFLTSIGYGVGSPAAAPSNLNDYTFRFHAVATGSILVMGGNKENAGAVLTNDLDATLAELNSDPGFVDFMSETSGALVVSDSVSFSQVIGSNFISAASGAPFASLAVSDQIVVVGSASNDATYTVQQVVSDSQVRVTPPVTPEAAGASVTITKV